MSVDALDSTGLGILVGALVAIGLALWQGVKHRSFHVNSLALNFLAAFGALAAASLIWAAFRGDPSNLPSAWREYLATSGVIGMGLAIQHLIKVLNALVRTPAKAAPPLGERTRLDPRQDPEGSVDSPVGN